MTAMVPQQVWVLVASMGCYDYYHSEVYDVTTTAIGAKKFANRAAGHELAWTRDGQGWRASTGVDPNDDSYTPHTFTIEPWNVIAR